VFLDVDFIDRLHGIVVGREGYTNNVCFVTDDGGFSWTRSYPPTRRWFTNVRMFSANHAYAGGLEQLLFQYGEPLPTPVPGIPPVARDQLLPNHPNPFNPVTTIPFVLSGRGHVSLTVHDVTGGLVATLVNGVRDAGAQSAPWNADGVSSGVYFARLRTADAELSRKMILLK
jgi:hypothetical protein